MFAALHTARVDETPAVRACAEEFSPRLEVQLGGHLVLIDVAGLNRIVGDAHAVHAELRARIVARGAPQAVVSIAPARIAALLLAVAGHDQVVPPGQTRAAVGALPLAVLETLATYQNPSKGSNRSPRPCPLCVLSGARRLCGEPGGACTELPTVRRWGLVTLGDLAALPAAALSARLGQSGVVVQRLARGLDLQPLVPVVEETRFEASLDLEWPIEALQPLSFVLTRLLDPVCAALERADRAAAAIATELTLVRLVPRHSMEEAAAPRHVRRLELPAPMRDPRVLRTLILLDLESHPPGAGIDRVAIRIEPTPGRITQFSLLERAGPKPETIATLVARLTAVMGEGRVGSPALVDSHAPDAFALTPFLPEARSQRPEAGGEVPEARGRGPDVSGQCPGASLGICPPGAGVLRRFRLPVAARVEMSGGRPVLVATDRVGIRGGEVRQCAGPWRSSGGWWSPCGPRKTRVERAAESERAGAGSPSEARAGHWDRDEFETALADGAMYRIYRDRHDDRWFIEGILD